MATYYRYKERLTVKEIQAVGYGVMAMSGIRFTLLNVLTLNRDIIAKHEAKKNHAACTEIRRIVNSSLYSLDMAMTGVIEQMEYILK